MRHKLIEVASGKEVKPGMRLIDSRKTIWTLVSFRVLTPPSTGRVTVMPVEGGDTRDFYPGVFDLKIVEVKDE